MARAEQLPLLPSVVMQVLSLTHNDPAYFDRLVALAEEDPTFAVRLIRVANSPSSAPIRPIVTVRQAAVRIGAKECAGLVTAMAVSKVFVPKTEAQRNLWVHALQVAIAARVISSLMLERTTTPEQAYLSGLLHDIGRFVMFEVASEDLRHVDESIWHTPQELLETERHLLGYDHVRLGAHVCRRWSLPEAFGELVLRHHDYAVRSSTLAHVSADLVRIVQMADLLSVLLLVTPELADSDPADLAATLQTHCVRDEWTRPPITAAVLAQRVAQIRDEAAVLAGNLLNA